MSKKDQTPQHVSSIDRELLKKHFRVAIFGSARIKQGDDIYKDVYDLAKMIGKSKFDIVTGGGPGVMEAANAGHAAGDPDNHSDSIGLTIQLPFEAKGNRYLEIRKHFQKFSGRLDQFVSLSNVFVIMPGGIGTALELFYVWQLTQVHHICKIPIVLVGHMWKELIHWVKKWQVDRGLVSPEDLDNIYPVATTKEAIDIILQEHQRYIDEDLEFDQNFQKYMIETKDVR